MKTVEEFIEEIAGSKAIRDELKAIKDNEELTAFLGKHGVSASAEDFSGAYKAKDEYEGELSDDTAEAVAGGIPLF